MIGPVTSPSLAQFFKQHAEQHEAARATLCENIKKFGGGSAEELGLTPVQAPPEFMAMMAKSDAEAAWMDSAEGKAWQAEQRAKQDAQPVELAVYKGGQMVGFMAGGFSGLGSMGAILPDNWGSMRTEDLKKVFQSHGFKVVTAKDGLSMNHGQAANILNRS
ncbi:hypothetical protein [Rhodovulum visakhapatnamense]|uniref:Uncharacterized protein n=1 Tax=Rhodovulum visakhapatnamense TaxID=364297 RepID=A0A4R8F082_9RHOB|nr:hypothetical protein [Rhodovulum visakhapatnamense]TDX18359.1 hypothetical protein EV657_1744 [Rhodovulum visakhapatnamense]